MTCVALPSTLEEAAMMWEQIHTIIRCGVRGAGDMGRGTEGVLPPLHIAWCPCMS